MMCGVRRSALRVLQLTECSLPSCRLYASLREVCLGLASRALACTVRAAPRLWSQLSFSSVRDILTHQNLTTPHETHLLAAIWLWLSAPHSHLPSTAPPQQVTNCVFRGLGF